MKSIRAIILLITFLPLHSVFGQVNSPAVINNMLINRLHHEISTARVQGNSSDTLPFSVTLSTAPLIASSEDDALFQGFIANNSTDSLSIHFDRTQNLPIGWTSSVCFGEYCYAPSVSSASYGFNPSQSLALIVHQYPALSDIPDTATIYLRLSAPAKDPADTMLLKLVTYFVPSDPPLIFKFSDTNYSQTFIGNGLHFLSPTLENHAAQKVTYDLTMQDSLPEGWTATMKIGSKSGTSIQYPFYGIGNADGNDQQLITFSIDANNVTKTDSAIIYLSVHPETTNPADSANYRFVAIVNPSSGVANEGNDLRAGIVVTNAWPNTLRASAKLNLEVSTDRSGVAIAHIYSIDGASVGTVTLG
ncbi:MAG TPA: hypothetical protein VG537_12000, partial [Candidatus Kapabacteria bacterium]|nr:hypothetical protein [Candidatus Kapabacteria bacterium]